MGLKNPIGEPQQGPAQVFHRVEAFMASVNRSSEVSLNLSEAHFPQIYGKPEINDRPLPSCLSGECYALKFPKLPVLPSTTRK